MLLTSLLSSASSLAVPSAAQKHFEPGTTDQHVSWPSSTSTDAIVRPGQQSVASVTLLHQQHASPERKQHGHRRPVDGGPGSPEVEDGDVERPNLYNLTLTAMRHYLRGHLNSSRYGKTPRKRSHVHVDDVDVEFYRRFKEFNSSQAALDGTATYPVGPLNSSQITLEPSVVSQKDATDPMEPLVDVSSEPPVAPSSPPVAPSGGQRDYSVLMDDPRGYITASSSFPLRPGKTSTVWNTSFVQHRGYIYGLVSFSVICALVLGLFGVFRCLRATTATRATAEALTLPIQFITDDLAPLNADLNHLPVPMLSVQSPGCAGMERLGVPAHGSIGSPPLRNERAGFHQQQQQQPQQQQQQQQPQPQQQPPSQQRTLQQQQHHHHHHHHHHLQYHQQSAAGQQHLRFNGDLLLSGNPTGNFRTNHSQSYLFIPHQPNGGGGSSGSNSINYKTHYSSSSYGGSSNGSSYGNANPITTSFPHCTHHVQLPDGEYGPDRDLQIRTPCQQSEIPRTYVKAPPNKTVRDVPVQYQSTGAIAGHGTNTTTIITTTITTTAGTAVSPTGGGDPGTISRPPEAGRLGATTSGPSLGANGGSKPGNLQKIFRLVSGKASKSSTSSSSSASSTSSSSSSCASSSSSSGINSASNNNNNIHHGLQPPAAPGSASTGSLNNNVISSISATYGPNSVSNGLGCSNHVNNNRVGCGASGGNSRVDGRGGLSLGTGGAGIHNHNQHYRSPLAVATITSPSSTSSSSSSSPLPAASSAVAGLTSGGSVTVPVVPGPGSDPGHAPFTM